MYVDVVGNVYVPSPLITKCVYTVQQYVHVYLCDWNYNVYYLCVLHTLWLVKDAKRDVEVLKAEREQATVARQEAEATLGNSKKELEAQELVG